MKILCNMINARMEVQYVQRTMGSSQAEKTVRLWVFKEQLIQSTSLGPDKGCGSMAVTCKGSKTKRGQRRR